MKPTTSRSVVAWVRMTSAPVLLVLAMLLFLVIGTLTVTTSTLAIGRVTNAHRVPITSQIAP